MVVGGELLRERGYSEEAVRQLPPHAVVHRVGGELRIENITTAQVPGEIRGRWIGGVGGYHSVLEPTYRKTQLTPTERVLTREEAIEAGILRPAEEPPPELPPVEEAPPEFVPYIEAPGAPVPPTDRPLVPPAGVPVVPPSERPLVRPITRPVSAAEVLIGREPMPPGHPLAERAEESRAAKVVIETPPEKLKQFSKEAKAVSMAWGQFAERYPEEELGPYRYAQAMKEYQAAESKTKALKAKYPKLYKASETLRGRAVTVPGTTETISEARRFRPTREMLFTELREATAEALEPPFGRLPIPEPTLPATVFTSLYRRATGFAGEAMFHWAAEPLKAERGVEEFGITVPRHDIYPRIRRKPTGEIEFVPSLQYIGEAQFRGAARVAAQWASLSALFTLPKAIEQFPRPDLKPLDQKGGIRIYRKKVGVRKEPAKPKEIRIWPKPKEAQKLLGRPPKTTIIDEKHFLAKKAALAAREQQKLMGTPLPGWKPTPKAALVDEKWLLGKKAAREFTAQRELMGKPAFGYKPKPVGRVKDIAYEVGKLKARGLKLDYAPTKSMKEFAKSIDDIVGYKATGRTLDIPTAKAQMRFYAQREKSFFRAVEKIVKPKPGRFVDTAAIKGQIRIGAERQAKFFKELDKIVKGPRTETRFVDTAFVRGKIKAADIYKPDVKVVKSFYKQFEPPAKAIKLAPTPPAKVVKPLIPPSKPTVAEAKTIKWMQKEIGAAYKTIKPPKAYVTPAPPESYRVLAATLGRTKPLLAEELTMKEVGAPTLQTGLGRVFKVDTKPKFKVEFEPRMKDFLGEGISPRLREVGFEKVFKAEAMKVTPKTKIGMGVREAITPKAAEITRTKELQKQVSVLATGVSTAQAQAIKTIQPQRTVELTKLITRPQKILKPRDITKPDFTFKIKTPPPTEFGEIFREQPPPFLLPKKKDFPQFRPIARVGGFEVFVKRAGEFVRVSKAPLGKRAALGLGAMITRGTAARTFKIEPIGKPGRRVPGLARWFKPEQFRAPFGKTRLPKGAYVEKVKFAIDLPGEFREITLRGRRAPRKKKRKSKNKRRRKR